MTARVPARGAPVRILASGPAGGVIGARARRASPRARRTSCASTWAARATTCRWCATARRPRSPAGTGTTATCRAADGERRDARRRRRLDLPRATAARSQVGPESAGAEPGPGLLRPRRHAPDRDRRDPRARPALGGRRVRAAASFRLTRARRRRCLPASTWRGPLGLERRGRGLRLLARRQREHDARRVRRMTAEQGHRPARARAARLRRQRPRLRRDPGRRSSASTACWCRRPRPPSRRSARSPRAPSIDEERSYLAPARSADLDAAARALRRARRAGRALPRAPRATRASAITARYQLNLRYPGQNWSLAVPARRSVRGARDLSSSTGHRGARGRALPRAHQAEYGHARRGEEPEITGVRLLAFGDVARAALRRPAGAPRVREPAPARTRRANLGDGFKETAVHRGPTLRPGDARAEPRDRRGDLHHDRRLPGLDARVDDAGDYVLERSS